MERVRQWRTSGKTAEDFAQSEEFEASTLRYWASRLKHADGAESEAAGSGVRMVRVKRARTASAEAPLLVLVGNARVEVRAGFDEAILRKVVDALGGGR